MQMTLVIVTHNPDLAALMARRITIVDGALVELN
jgi:ABC-type lipoprotein export system ATPase subunit